MQIAYGAAKDSEFPFDIFDFAKNFKIDVITTYNSLKILESTGLITYAEDTNSTSRIMFIVNREDLYRFQIENEKLDSFIKMLLRTYTGIFNDFINISEEYLARKVGTTVEIIVSLLKTLRQFKIITYVPRINKPLIHFVSERLEDKAILFNKKDLAERKERSLQRMEAMLHYATSSNKCRSQQLLAYFGEDDVDRCGSCDVCVRRNDLSLNKYEFDIILNEIKNFVTLDPCLLNVLVDKINYDEHKIIKVVQWLFENKKMIYDDEQKLTWNKEYKL